MIDFPIVDSHVHLCDPQRLSYSWMKNAPTLNRVVLPRDFFEAAAPVAIDRFVFVEVDVDRPQHLDEAAWVSGLARTESRLAGIVISLPLEKGIGVESELDQLTQYPKLRGIRRLIQSEPDPNFCVQPDFIAALKLLARHDLVFDICIFHHQMPSVIRMVSACPEVRFVLDHIGKPGIKAGLFDPWRAHLNELASLPNVVGCKISGVVTEADHANWTREEVRPYIDHAIESFGFDRVMFGGDWHVLSLAGSYPDWVGIVDWATQNCTAEERQGLFRDNARAIYRLGR